MRKSKQYVNNVNMQSYAVYHHFIKAATGTLGAPTWPMKPTVTSPADLVKILSLSFEFQELLSTRTEDGAHLNKLLDGMQVAPPP